MIEARNLKKVYSPKKGVSVNALDDVSVKLPEKGMVFILGKSGSGKSTLLNVLGGLDSIDSGEILIKGSSLKDFKQKHYDSYRNTYVGFIFQEHNILEEFTVGANVALAIELQGRRATDDEINKILKEVDLDGLGGRKPNELSGGQKQRVAIARALVKNPEIIMADEPTGALDSKTGKQVFDTLKSLSKEKLVVIVSHDRDFAEQYADRIIELADGKIISDVELSPDAVVSGANEESSLNFDGNNIEIKAGYSLTEEDRIAINSYISALRDGATIVIDNGKKKISSSAFVPTDETKIEIKKDSFFKLIKSRLSLRNSFKLGASGLKHKKFRLVLTILLSFIAFTLFGVADTIASYDNIGTAVKSIKDSKIDYASFGKSVKIIRNDDEDDFYWNDRDNLLSDADIASIKEKSGIDTIGVYKFGERYDSSSMSFSNNIPSNTYGMVYSDRFCGFAEMTQDKLNQYGYALYGAFPDGTKNEIAISSFVFNYFKKAGYIESGETKTVSSYNDIIGKTLTVKGFSEPLKITGVFDTKFDESRYDTLLENNLGSDMGDQLIKMVLSKELDSVRNYSLNCVAIVGNGFIQGHATQNTSALTDFYGDINLRKILETITHYEGNSSWEEEKSGFYVSARKMTTLSQIGLGNVAFFDSNKTSLNDNEFILSLSSVRDAFNSGNSDGVNFWDSEVLKDFERTYNENSNLQDVLNNYKTYALSKYAYEHKEETRAYLIQYRIDNYGDDLNSATEFINGYNDRDLMQEYVNSKNIWTSELSEEDKAICSAYLDDVIQRYALSSTVIPKNVRDALPSNFSSTITYQSYIDIGFSIACYKYAYNDENLGKATDYYSSQNPSVDINTVSKEEKQEMYYNSLISLGYNTEMQRENPDIYSTIKEMYLKDVANILATNDNFSGLTFEMYNYQTGKQTKIKGTALVVGIADLPNESNNYIILPDSLYQADSGIYSFAIGPMPSDDADMKKAVALHYDESGEVRYDLSNAATFQLFSLDETLETVGQVFLYVGLGFALFAALMLSNFIAVSISYKKQEIGILRAIGSRSTDVFKIFFSESFIIAMINYVLAVSGTLSASIVANTLIREEVGLYITFLNFGIRQLVILLAVSLAIALIATFLPVRKAAKKKPIDAIRNR